MEEQFKEWPSAKTIKDIADAYTSIYEAKKKVDQDEDGDNDFADVRIARMIASGVPKEVAIQKTKNKPYNEEVEIDEAAKRVPRKVRGAKDPVAYMKGRSDAGKRISGNEKEGPASYASRWHKGSPVTQPGQKPQNVQPLSKSEKEEIAIRKANLKKEEYQIYEIVASYLLENNFAETINDANVIIENMSEVWLDEILTEKKWIAGAIKHPGAFTKKAKAHGMSTSEFAAYVDKHPEKFPTKTERQANLSQTLRKFK